MEPPRVRCLARVSGHIMLRREVTSDDDTELTLEMLPVPSVSAVMTLCSPEPDQAWSRGRVSDHCGQHRVSPKLCLGECHSYCGHPVPVTLRHTIPLAVILKLQQQQ